MMQVPATSAVTRHDDDGPATVYACRAHVLATMRLLGGQGLTVAAADPAIHGCKGCLDDWPP